MAIQEIQTVLVDYAIFNPTCPGNGFVFNSFFRTTGEESQTDTYKSAFLDGEFILGQSEFTSESVADPVVTTEEFFSGGDHLCHSWEAIIVETNTPPGNYMVTQTPAGVTTTTVIDTLERLLERFTFNFVPALVTGDFFGEQLDLTLGYPQKFRYIYKSTISYFIEHSDQSSTSIQAHASYFVHPLISLDRSYSFLSSTTYLGVDLDPCRINAPNQLLYPFAPLPYTPRLSSSQNESTSESVFPVLQSVDDSKVLSVLVEPQEDGTTDYSTIIQSASGRIGLSSFPGSIDGQSSVKFFNDLMSAGGGGKGASFASYFKGNIYLAIEEYNQLVPTEGEPFPPERTYFRNSAVDQTIKFQGFADTDTSLEFQESEEPVKPLEIPEGLVYGIDFRIDGISLFA